MNYYNNTGMIPYNNGGNYDSATFQGPPGQIDRGQYNNYRGGNRPGANAAAPRQNQRFYAPVSTLNP